MMLITERRSWRSQVYCNGVSPTGDHVRRRTGWSMKPLSSRKNRGLSDSRAPFLFVATPVRATVVERFRRIPARAARVSGKSTSCRAEFSKRATGGRKPEMFWRWLPPCDRMSKDRSCNRLVAVRLEGFPTTVASVSRRDEVEGQDAACFSMHPCHLVPRAASTASPKKWKPLQSRRPRRFPCLPAEVVPLADGESPTRLRFHAFSYNDIRIPIS
jgi:hypothetical protein